MGNNNQITQVGLDKLQKELQTLKEVKRPAIVERLQVARAMGDLKENSEYQDSREQLNLLDERIHEIETNISTAEVIESSTSTDTVQIGNTVTVEANGKKLEYTIVGEMESDISKGMLSKSSPIGEALLGKKLNDIVTVEIPAGTLTYKILKIT